MFSDDFKADVARWGWRRKLFDVLMRRLSGVLVLTAVVSRPLQQGNSAIAADQTLKSQSDTQLVVRDAAGREIVQRLATRADLDKFAQHMPEGMKVWALGTEPDYDNVCWGVFVDGEMASMAWRAYRDAPMKDGLTVGFAPHCRYGLNAYTRPEFRGQHLFNQQQADALCATRGCTDMVAFVDVNNYSSLTRTKRSGSKVVGYAGYLKLGQQVLPFRTPGAKRYSFRFYKA